MKSEQLKNIFRLFLLIAGIFFYSMPLATAQQISLSLTNPDDAHSDISILFAADATDAFDQQYEARRHRGTAPLSFFSKIDTGAYSVQALPLLTDDRTITLGIDAAVSGLHFISLKDAANLDESISIVLEDTYNDSFLNLRTNQDYWFNLTAGTDIERFKLHINPPLEITTVNGTCDGTQSKFEIKQAGSYLWNYEIKDETGFLIDADSSWNGTVVFNELPTGTYTVSLTDVYGYSFMKQASIIDKKAVVAQFQVSDSIAPVNKEVHFYDYSIGASDYLWDFGDGNVQTGTPFPTNTFTRPGTYYVQFIASNDECGDVSSKIIQVMEDATAIEKWDVEDVLVSSSSNEVFVNFKNQKSSSAIVEIYNLIGQRIYRNEFTPAGLHKIKVHPPGQYCLVKVLIDGNSIVKKVFLHGY